MVRSPCCGDISELKRGPWTPEEDAKLVSYIQKHGQGCWRSLPKAAGLNRCGKSCRLRWANYLRPGIKRGHFSEEDDDVIIQLHALHGNKWSLIAAHLPGRTDNEIKNYWNTHLKKKLLHMGIDPVTHKSRADLDHLSNYLAQVLSPPPHLGASMKPRDISDVLTQQPNVAAEVAKLQVLQNISQILNTTNSSLPNMDHILPSNLGFPIVNGLFNVHDNNNGVLCSSSLGLCPIPDYVGSSQTAVKKYDSSAELDLSLDTNYYDKSLSNTTTTYGALNEARLPSMADISPEAFSVNQMESNINYTNGSSAALTPTNGPYLEDWEKVLDDGNDFWKKFLK